MSYPRFISIMAAICFGGYAGLLVLGMSQRYCEYTKTFDISACYKFDVHDQSADILLVGDSALLYGIKPKIVASVAQHTAYNYGVIGEVFTFAPSAVIDRYLKMNRRPRAIIAYIGPWHAMDPGRINDPHYIPVGAAALQHPDVISILGLIAARPAAIVELPQIVGTGLSFRREQIRSWRRKMEDELGFVDYASQLPPEDRSLKRCISGRKTPIPDLERSRAVFNGLKRRYAKIGIPFYVYVAPFARCRAPLRELEIGYRGISDNEPTALDDSLFVDEHATDDGGQVHVNNDGSVVVSKMLGEFIVAHPVTVRQ